MKFDVLHAFRANLQEDASLRKESVDTYYKAAKKVLEGQQFDRVEDIDRQCLQESLVRLDTKSELSAAKNSLKRMRQMFPGLPVPDEAFFRQLSLKRRNRRKRKLVPLELDTIKRKINAIRNEKLKLAYRLALISGLRVSELASLKQRDICFSEDGAIRIHVRDGKGGRENFVDCLHDTYVSEEMRKYVERLQEDERVFYGPDMMIQKAGKLGFECHDLRRAYAKRLQQEKKDELGSIYEANKAVQEGLRHERYSTTKRYLSRKIKM